MLKKMLKDISWVTICPIMHFCKITFLTASATHGEPKRFFWMAIFNDPL